MDASPRVYLNLMPLVKDLFSVRKYYEFQYHDDKTISTLDATPHRIATDVDTMASISIISKVHCDTINWTYYMWIIIMVVRLSKQSTFCARMILEIK